MTRQISVENVHWTDNAFPIVLEVLAVLAGDYYIVTRELEQAGFISLPFVIGLLITSAVGAFALHWAISKKNKKLVGTAFVIWFLATFCILLTSGLDWQADHRITAHRAEIQLAADAKAKITQSETDSRLKLLDKGNELLKGTRDKTERASILAAVGINPSQAKKSGPPSEDGVPVPIQWTPFPEGTFASWWYNGVSNFMAVIGLILGGVLMFVKITTRTDFSTSQSGTTVLTTQHEVTTAPQPIGFAAPTMASDPKPQRLTEK